MQTRDAKGLFQATHGTRKHDRQKPKRADNERCYCPHCGELLTGPSSLYSCPKSPITLPPLVDPVEYLREEMRRDANRIARVQRMKSL